MNSRAILESFADPDDYREFAQRPWVHNGYAYATNGHWLVRMPAEGLGDITPWTKGVHPKGIEEKFSAGPFEHLKPMEPIDCAPCAHCDGLGRAVMDKCPSCKGKGHFNHHGEIYECQLCDGEGKAQRAARNGETATERCMHCSGTGNDFGRHITRVKYQSNYFQPGYLAALSRLPGIQFGTYPVDKPDPNAAAAFRFEGGEGLLMPCMEPKDGAA